MPNARVSPGLLCLLDPELAREFRVQCKYVYIYNIIKLKIICIYICMYDHDGTCSVPCVTRYRHVIILNVQCDDQISPRYMCSYILLESVNKIHNSLIIYIYENTRHIYI